MEGKSCLKLEATQLLVQQLRNDLALSTFPPQPPLYRLSSSVSMCKLSESEGREAGYGEMREYWGAGGNSLPECIRGV